MPTLRDPVARPFTSKLFRHCARACVVQHHLADSLRETGVPNVVTSVLASYRGYDTLGETTVVFTAGAGVIALLRRRRRGGPHR